MATEEAAERLGKTACIALTEPGGTAQHGTQGHCGEHQGGQEAEDRSEGTPGPWSLLAFVRERRGRAG